LFPALTPKKIRKLSTKPSHSQAAETDLRTEARRVRVNHSDSEIQRDRALEAMRYAQGNAAKMVVHSPMEGVVVYNTIWLGGEWEPCSRRSGSAGRAFLQVVIPPKWRFVSS